jgi:hypothetical protein
MVRFAHVWPVHVPPQPLADKHSRPRDACCRPLCCAWERLPAPISWPDLVTQHSVVSTTQLVAPPFPATGGRCGVSAHGLVVEEPTDLILLHHHGVILCALTAWWLRLQNQQDCTEVPKGKVLLFLPLKAVLQSHQTEMQGVLVPGGGGPQYLSCCCRRPMVRTRHKRPTQYCP